MSKEIQEIAERLKKYLEFLYGEKIKNLYLYGSYARGSATAGSDVDLLVLIDESLDVWQVRRSLDDIILEILLNTGKLISVIVVKEDYFNLFNSPFIINVKREGIKI